MPDSVQRSRFSATQSQFRRLIPSKDHVHCYRAGIKAEVRVMALNAVSSARGLLSGLLGNIEDERAREMDAAPRER